MILLIFASAYEVLNSFRVYVLPWKVDLGTHEMAIDKLRKIISSCQVMKVYSPKLLPINLKSLYK